MSYGNHQTGFIRISDIILILTCSTISWAGSIPFIDSPWLRLVLAFICGILLSRAAGKWLQSKRQIFLREQFKWLLEHLITRLTAGATLESSFLDASANLNKILGKNSTLLLGLGLLERQLTARQPLHAILPQFGRYLPCSEARRFFQILPELRQAGGQVSQFVRHQLGMILEQIALHQDMSAETTQRQTEAILLTAMPFVLAFLLRNTSEAISGGQFSTPLGVNGMLIAYCLAMIAAVLTFGSIGFVSPRARKPVTLKPQRNGDHLPGSMAKLGKLLHKLYQNILPDSYGGRLLQILQVRKSPADADGIASCQLFFQRKSLLMLIVMVPASLFVWIFPSLWYLMPALPLAISLLQDQQIFRAARQRQLEYQLDYPLFLTLIASLLQSGISVHIALDICLRAYPANLGKSGNTHNQAFYQDLSDIRRHLQIGMPASQIIEYVAASCPVAEAQAALLLIARYDRTGGNEILQVLQIQALSCQSLYRNTIRKQLEWQSLRLLLPMTLDLLSVILTTILPAVQSLLAI